MEVLLYCSKTVKKLAGGEAPVPCKAVEKGEMQVRLLSVEKFKLRFTFDLNHISW